MIFAHADFTEHLQTTLEADFADSRLTGHEEVEGRLCLFKWGRTAAQIARTGAVIGQRASCTAPGLAPHIAQSVLERSDSLSRCPPLSRLVRR